MWGNHFGSLLNSITNDSCNNVVQTSVNSIQYYNTTDFYCYVSIIGILMNKLPCNSAAGFDGVRAEHLFYCSSRINPHLSIFFNMCLTHGHLPVSCLKTVISPVIKNTIADVSDANNYRPIDVSTIFSKLFEHVILHFISFHLQTSDNQFGFKAKHGTDLCAFLLKQSIASYVNQNTPVYAAFLDASKAYDRVNHAVLFKKLIAHDVPMCFVRLLQF